MWQRGRWKTLCGTVLAAGVMCMASGCSQSLDGDTDSEEAPTIRPEQSTGTQHLNEPPIADFEIGAELPEDGDPISFDASESSDPDGDELTYAWRFGDDIPAGGQKVSHIYTDGGDFEVTLTVSDEAGATDSVTRTVSIKDTPFGQGNAEVTIIARDLDFHDMEGVELSPVGSDVTKQTGQDGKATFKNMPTDKPLVFEATKDGYAKQVARMRLPGNTSAAPMLIRMQEIGKVVTVDHIEDGGEVQGYDGARLEFPPEAVVDSDGDPVTGAIDIEFTTFDVSERPEIDGFPGAFLGLRPNGDIDPILSFGAMEVNLKQDGEDLQVKPGKAVEMDIPAYAEGIPMEADIPVWSLDESTGIWVDEGNLEPVQSDASPTGRALRTEVTHFTTWNGDFPLTTPCKMKPKCKIVDPQTGDADAPLKAGETCEVKVTSDKDGIAGLGNSCNTPEARVEGKTCSNDSDCFYWKEEEDCSSGDTCTTTRTKVEPSGISCNTSSLPGGQSIPGGGVCKSNGCPGVQFCSGNSPEGSGPGACSLPASGGVFAGATGQYNETFQVDAKGEYVSGPDNPEADQGWLWVPNTGLTLKGLARKGTLHGATNVDGHDSANKEFKDGTAVTCNEERPVIPLRHQCQSGAAGISGNCPDVRRKHFCEMLFRCPGSDFARSVTQVLGTPNVQECVDKFENDFDLPMLEDALDAGRISFNGNRSANCLDRIAALREDVDSANSIDDRREACAKFDRKALELNACTGVEGSVGKGQACAHDLECKDDFSNGNKINRRCERDNQNACLGTCKDSNSANRMCGNTVCGYGEFCEDTNCKPKRTSVGAQCNDANQCGPGLFCNLNKGQCESRQFVSRPGGSCSRQKTCALGLQCMEDGQGDYKCTEFSKPGGSCAGEAGGGVSGCMWDAFCDSGQCHQKKLHGDSCGADHECMSGACKGLDPDSQDPSGNCFGPHRAMSCP